MASFYEDFFGHFSESSPPASVLVGDLIDLGGPPPAIPFGTRPVRGPPPPIHRLTRPSPVPSPDPLPVFTPSLVSPAGFTGTTDLAPMGLPTWQHWVGQFSPASSISSTATSGFSITRPGLTGRIPPIPQPFTGAKPSGTSTHQCPSPCSTGNPSWQTSSSPRDQKVHRHARCV